MSGIMQTWQLAVLAVAGLGCGSSGGFPDAAVLDGPPGPGTMALSWAVTTGDPAVAAVCSDLGAESVLITIENMAVLGGDNELFPCSAQMGVTSGVAPGRYRLDFELHGRSAKLSGAPTLANIVVREGEQTVVPLVTFHVTAP